MPEFIGYSDVSRIYKGPLSCVYKARENSTQETRALKLLRLSKSQIEFNYTATISSPNVVRVFNHSPHQGEVEQEVSYNFRGNKLGFFSMEFLDGPDLKDIIMKGGLPAPAAVNFMLTVAKALLPLWREGKIHADIKPRNILSIPNRGPVIIDFGIGSEYKNGWQSSVGEMALYGTPQFASPERFIEGNPYCPRWDFFSLGLTLFQAITGRNPWLEITEYNPILGKDIRVSIMNKIPYFNVTHSFDDDRITASLRDFLIHASHHDFDQRISDPMELIRQLQALNESLSSASA